jgi:hypothetical protein
VNATASDAILVPASKTLNSASGGLPVPPATIHIGKLSVAATLLRAQRSLIERTAGFIGAGIVAW